MLDGKIKCFFQISKISRNNIFVFSFQFSKYCFGRLKTAKYFLLSVELEFQNAFSEKQLYVKDSGLPAKLENLEN